MSSANKIRPLIIYTIIFFVFFALTLVTLQNDYRVNFSAKLNGMQDEYFVIYRQNGVLTRQETKVTDSHIQHNIPLNATDLYLLGITKNLQIKSTFDVKYITKRQVINTEERTVDKQHVSQTFINNREVDITDFVPLLKAEQTRLRAFFFFESCLIGLCAVALAYIGVFLYKRKHMVDAKFAGLWQKTADRDFLFQRLAGNGKFKLFFLMAFTIVILFWRRPGQFIQPFIFYEDGTFILNDFLAYGYTSLFETINGYLVFSSKLINFLAYRCGFWYYPEFASLFTNIFILFVIVAIAFAPTHLKKPYFCAIMTVLVKTGSECFSVALYSFWWAGLLLMLAVLWQNDKKVVLRNIFIIVGGTSSPIIVIVTPLLIILALYTKHKNDVITAIIAFCFCALQLAHIMTFPGSSTGSLFNIELVLYTLRNYFGTFFLLQTQWYYLLTFCGIIMLAIILTCGLKWRQTGLRYFISDNLYFIMLLLMLGGSIASSLVRFPVMLEYNTFPLQAHVPRYFFYPFILLAWTSIWIIAATPNQYPKIVVKILLFLVLFNFLFGGAYRGMQTIQPAIDWREKLTASIIYGETLVPMLSNTEQADFYTLYGGDTVRMIERSCFFNDVNKNLENFIHRKNG